MGATFKLSGSGAGAVKAVTDLQKALKDVDKAADGAAKSNAQLEKQAKRVAEQADPQRRYNRQMQELATLVDKGKVSMQDAERVAERYGIQLDRANKFGKQAFGMEAIRSIASYAAGVLSVGTAISQVNKFFQETEQRAQAAADAVLSSLGTFGELQQLSPADFAANAALARQLQSTGAFKDGNAAARTAFNIRSAGFSDAEQQVLLGLVQQRKVSGENIEAFGGNVRRIQQIFGADAGSLDEVINKVAETSKRTLVSASDTAREVTKFAGLARSAGLTDEEAFAAFGVAEGRSASAENAAEKLKSFFAQVNKRQLGGGSLQDIIARIESKTAEGATLFDVLGEQNAVIGFQDLVAGRAALAEQVAGIRAAAGRGLVQQSPLLLDDPSLGAALVREQSQGALDTLQQQSPEAVRESLFDAYRNQLRQRYIREGRGNVSRYYSEAAFGLTDFFGSEDSRLEGAVGSNEFTPELRLQIARYLQSQGETSAVTLSEDQTRIEARRLDRIIELLERQLGIQEQGVRAPANPE